MTQPPGFSQLTHTPPLPGLPMKLVIGCQTYVRPVNILGALFSEKKRQHITLEEHNLRINTLYSRVIHWRSTL